MHVLTQSLNKVEKKFHSDHYAAELHGHLAQVLMMEGKYDLAIAQTQAELDADASQISAYYLRARIYRTEGKNESSDKARKDASATIAALLRQEPKADLADVGDPQVLFLAQSSDETETNEIKFSSEIISLLNGRNNPPLTPMEHVVLAEAYFDLGNIDAGKAEWETAIKFNPKFDNAVAHHRLGSALLKAQRTADARPHLRKAYELDPQNMTYRTDYESAKNQAPSHLN